MDATDALIGVIHQEVQTLSLQTLMLRLLCWRVSEGDGLLKQNNPQPNLVFVDGSVAYRKNISLMNRHFTYETTDDRQRNGCAT